MYYKKLKQALSKAEKMPAKIGSGVSTRDTSLNYSNAGRSDLSSDGLNPEEIKNEP